MLHLTRMQLKYVGTNSTNASAETPNNHHSNVIFRMLRRLTDALLSIISKIAPVMFYSLQFMDTYFEEDGGAQKTLSSFTVPDPPSMPKVKFIYQVFGIRVIWRR